MPPEETLSAVVKARDRISSTLNDIAGEMREVAKTSQQAAAATSATASAFDEAEDEGSALSRALNSLSSSTARAGGSLSATQHAADEAGDTFSRSAWQTRSLNQQLERIPRNAYPAAASLTALRAASTGVGGEVGIGTGAETASAQRSLRSFQTTVDRLRSVGIDVPVDTEGADETHGTLDSIRQTARHLDAAGINTSVDATGDEATETTLRRIQATGQRLDTMGVSPTVDAEGDEETAGQLGALQNLANTIDRTVARPRVEADGIATTLAEIQAVNRALTALDSREVDTSVDVDAGRSAIAGLVRDTAGGLDVRATADTTDAQRSLRPLQGTINRLNATGINVPVDTRGDEETERAVDSVRNTVLATDRTAARPHIEAEGVGETLSQTTAVDRAISRLNDRRADTEVDVDGVRESATGIGTIDRAISRLDGREADAEVDVDVDRAAMGGVLRDMGQRIQRQGIGLDPSSLGLDKVFSSVDVDYSGIADVRDELEEVRSGFADLPTFDIDVEDEEDLDGLASQLRQASSTGRALGDTFEEIGDDDIIGDAEGVSDLRRRLSGLDTDTNHAVVSLDRLEGASRDIVEEMIAGSGSVDEFSDEVEQTGDRALETSTKLGKLEGSARDLVLETAGAARSSSKLAREIDDIGDESIESSLQVGALSASLRGLEPQIGSITTRLGPFTTQLSNWINLLPVIASLTSALGGLATAGGAAGGALAGIFTGGLLAQGEQMADQMETMVGATGETGDRVEDLEEAGSDLERTMIGVEEVMAQIKQAAFDALEPLRTPEFADFTMTAIEGGLTLLSEVAQGIASTADMFTEFGSSVAGAFWDTLPAISEELGLLVQDLLPAFESFTIGAIEALPGLFAAMRQEGNELLPMLGDFVNALVGALPTLTTWGTLLLRLILPALTGFFEGIAMLAPALDSLAGALEPVIENLSPLIRDMGKLLGIFAALAVARTTVVTILGLTVGIFASMAMQLAGLVRVGAMLLPVLKGIVVGLASLVGWPVTAILLIGTAIAGLMSYFDMWDEWLWDIMEGWNALVSAFSVGAGLIGQALESVFNPFADWVNSLLDRAEELTGRDFGTVEGYDYEPLDYEAMQFDREDATAAASYIPGQDDEGGAGGGGGTTAPSPTPDTAAKPGRPTEGQSAGGGRGRGRGETTATNIEKVEVNVGGDGDKTRIRNAVRDGIDQADREKRRRGTPGM